MPLDTTQNPDQIIQILKSTDILTQITSNQQIQIDATMTDKGEDTIRKEFLRFGTNILDTSITKYSKLEQALSQKVNTLTLCKKKFLDLAKWRAEYLT